MNYHFREWRKNQFTPRPFIIDKWAGSKFAIYERATMRPIVRADTVRELEPYQKSLNALVPR